jgi:hypothetical protein
LFVKKEFGILGDRGFTFNRKNELVQIKGWKPRKSLKTHEDKYYNKYLSSMRVVIENSINCVKQWCILKCVYRYWHNGKGLIKVNNVLTAVVVLTNRKIKQNSILSASFVNLILLSTLAPLGLD